MVKNRFALQGISFAQMMYVRKYNSQKIAHFNSIKRSKIKKSTVAPICKLQFRTAGEENPRRKRGIWKGRNYTSPAQRLMTTGAILFGVTTRIHIHLKPAGLHMRCFCCCCLGEGESMFLPTKLSRASRAELVILMCTCTLTQTYLKI